MYYLVILGKTNFCILQENLMKVKRKRTLFFKENIVV